MADGPLMSVEELSIRPGADLNLRPLVDSLTFEIGVERLALVGESGSGKSLTARALLGLLRAPLHARMRRLQWLDTDLTHASERRWTRLRGADICLMLQDPRFSLNPVLTVERQLEAVLAIHGRVRRGERRSRIGELLRAVGLEDQRRVLRAYPHQLSGGMGQRVVLAMMLLNGPRLLIADEPTSALDVDMRDQVLDLMVHMVDMQRMGLLLISHDLKLVARYCTRALVMCQGRIVDECAAAALGESRHAYTQSLWSCTPSGKTFGTALPVVDRACLP